ncbi:MAG TPA: hypothetical protein VKA21_11415 [Candidatus Binatia bacterium]|nr:hypothetical protein [Candidatus Binatia bacterium]
MRLLSKTILWAIATLLLAARAQAWQVVLDGGTSGADDAVAVTTDAAGNVVAAGFTTGANGTDMTVVKRAASDGALLWPAPATLDGTAHGDDEANAVAIDGAGDVLVAGFTTNTGTGKNFTVAKLAGSDGHELWRRTIAGTNATGFDEALAVAVDAAGNVIAAGFVFDTGPMQQLAVVKFDSGGTAVWPTPFKLKGTSIGGNVANAVVVDAAGNAVVAGAIGNNATGLDFTVIKLASAAGTALWTQTTAMSGPNDDEARAVAVDANGDVLAAGETGAGSGRDFAVAKLSGADGTLLWPTPVLIDGASGPDSEDEAFAVAVDGMGNAIAAGTTVNTSELGDVSDFTVVKLAAADGTELWRTTTRGADLLATANAAFGVAVDPAGNAFAGGIVQNADGGDFALVELAAGDGHEFWHVFLDGDMLTDVARSVAVDGYGNAIAAGRIRSATDGGDLATVKLGCGGGDPVVCAGPDACRLASFCDPATVACVAPPKPDGTTCNDGNACTRQDACQAGACSGDPVVCDGGACRIGGTCNTATGTCDTAVAPDGTACDDGDSCTTTDACRSGVCAVQDLDGATCDVSGAQAEPSCAGDKVPRGVIKGLKRTGTLLRAVATLTDTKRDKALAKADKLLGRVARAVDKAAGRKKKPLSSACASALRAAIADARQRIGRL